MIHVTRAAVFVYDVFSFAPGEIEWLGYWSCEHIDVLTPLLGVLDDLLGENFNFWDAEPPPPGYALLQNADFRDYQARLRKGMITWFFPSRTRLKIFRRLAMSTRYDRWNEADDRRKSADMLVFA